MTTCILARYTNSAGRVVVHCWVHGLLGEYPDDAAAAAAAARHQAGEVSNA